MDPRIVLRVPGYDERLMKDLPDRDVSIEGSGGVFAGSGAAGLIRRLGDKSSQSTVVAGIRIFF